MRPQDRPRVIGLYDEVTNLFKHELAAGIRAGVFLKSHEREMTNAILTLCLGVSTWYRETGPLSAEQIAELYADLVLRMVSGQCQQT